MKEFILLDLFRISLIALHFQYPNEWQVVDTSMLSN